MIKKTFNKKTMAMSVLIILIIALIAGGILIYAGVRFANLTRKRADIDTCRFSVMINSEVENIGKSIIDETTIQCPAIAYKAEAKDTTGNNIDSILKQLDDCWYKMGAGDFKVHGSEAAHQTYCIVCSEFTLNNNIELTELNSRLEFRDSKHNPKKKLNEYLKYETYSSFSGVFGKDGKTIQKIEKSSENNENNYIVVFRRKALSWIVEGAQGIGDIFLPKDAEKTKDKYEKQEFQDVFIVHESGLQKMDDNYKKDTRDRRETGNYCDQLLWEPWVD